ncbi:hypothetical protein O0L34_g4409 [Tuta absoluta]|nr:hypothetical protein O0L34_g4409 [Tuta absoluta]
MLVENDERRLTSLLNEVLEHSSDKSSSSEVPDHYSEHERESDTQEINVDYAERSTEWDSDDDIPPSAIEHVAVVSVLMHLIIKKHACTGCGKCLEHAFFSCKTCADFD